MTIDIFSMIVNMTTFNSFVISLPFLMVLYSNLFYFIMFHEGTKLLTVDNDDSDDEDTTDTTDTKVSCNIKFNNDYEHKYMDKLTNATKAYNFTDDELAILTTKMTEFRNEAEYNVSKKEEETSLMSDILKKAEEFVIAIRLEKLLNSYVLESTPLGNVVMRYNFNIEAFEFFSDSTIPYRYLETVSRKYVLTHKCVYLYVDMAQSLKDSEVKQQ